MSPPKPTLAENDENQLWLSVKYLNRYTIDIMPASPDLAKAAADPCVYENLYLHPLMVHPLSSLHRYDDLMKRCLTSDNLDVHYISGIQDNKKTTLMVSDFYFLIIINKINIIIPCYFINH